MINAQGGVTLGDGTILAPEVVILSSSHDYKQGALLPYDVYDVRRPVEIGRGVWLGYRAMICPGVRIGDGAIVAMGAVVTRDVASGEVVGGNPAKPLSRRDCDAISRMVAAENYFHKKHWSGQRPRVMAASD
ncbi:acyltransferase [Rhodovulum sulfidophilum]|nr:acyltransferase [Rhodovulum sulfidophilum]MBL3587377.1 acyltransferase [Rhodovulum sulfidophilum]